MWRKVAFATVLVLLMAGCVSRPAADTAVIRESAPPWGAPRDAVSYIDAAGLEQQPLNVTGNQRVLTIKVFVADEQVTVPGFIGIDRLRAVQAAAHTHDDSGTIWLEGEQTEKVTLADFFTLWGVRFDPKCLGDACGGVTVVVDGERVAQPATLLLSTVNDSIEVRAEA